jgi:hypothetical protein
VQFQYPNKAVFVSLRVTLIMEHVVICRKRVLMMRRKWKKLGSDLLKSGHKQILSSLANAVSTLYLDIFVIFVLEKIIYITNRNIAHMYITRNS